MGFYISLLLALWETAVQPTTTLLEIIHDLARFKFSYSQQAFVLHPSCGGSTSG